MTQPWRRPRNEDGCRTTDDGCQSGEEGRLMTEDWSRQMRGKFIPTAKCVGKADKYNHENSGIITG